MSNATKSNITALAMVIRASLAELRVCAEDMARDVKSSLPRLIDEASVLSSALQRLDRSLEELPASAGRNASQDNGDGPGSTPASTADPDFAEKWLLVLDRAQRLGAGHRCPTCGGVL